MTEAEKQDLATEDNPNTARASRSEAGPTSNFGLAGEQDPSKFPSLNEYVTATLKDAILSRVLPPKTRLKEESLARELGVSRLPVREALKFLSVQGLVVLRPHGRGAAVAEITPAMLRQVYQVRAALELLSVELAVDLMSVEALDRLDSVVEDGIRAVERKNWSRAAILGSEFHRIIAAGSGNEHLIELIESYDEKLKWANEPVSLDRGSTLWEEHRRIAEAIRLRNRKLARKLMREHTTKSGESLSSRSGATGTQSEKLPGLLRCV